MGDGVCVKEVGVWTSSGSRGRGSHSTDVLMGEINGNHFKTFAPSNNYILNPTLYDILKGAHHSSSLFCQRTSNKVFYFKQGVLRANSSHSIQCFPEHLPEDREGGRRARDSPISNCLL